MHSFLAPQPRASVREDVGEMLHQMSHEKYQWMRERITRLWPDWSQAAKHLEQNKPAFKKRLVKNVRFKEASVGSLSLKEALQLRRPINISTKSHTELLQYKGRHVGRKWLTY